jgi:hypothetical protein
MESADEDEAKEADPVRGRREAKQVGGYPGAGVHAFEDDQIGTVRSAPLDERTRHHGGRSPIPDSDRS